MSSSFEPGAVPETVSPPPEAPTPPASMTSAMSDVMALLSSRPKLAPTFIGASEWSARLLMKVNRLSAELPPEIPVTITGPSGTGKEVIARHFAQPGYPFIALNMAAIPEDLITSILFGHVKGAFTGAVETTNGAFIDAGRGTIFLDEIGDMPKQLQPVLLRVIQEREVSRVGDCKTRIPITCRIVCATNQDLSDETIFRGDLYARLNMVALEMLPIAHPDRHEDLFLIAEHFGLTRDDVLNTFNIPDDFELLRKHNVRALQKFGIRKKYNL